MPLVTVNLFKGRTVEEKYALQEAVHAALVDEYGIPDHDCNQRIV